MFISCLAHTDPSSHDLLRKQPHTTFTTTPRFRSGGFDGIFCLICLMTNLSTLGSCRGNSVALIDHVAWLTKPDVLSSSFNKTLSEIWAPSKFNGIYRQHEYLLLSLKGRNCDGSRPPPYVFAVELEVVELDDDRFRDGIELCRLPSCYDGRMDSLC